MGAFALGTLPALLGIGTAGAVLDGRTGRTFVRLSGAIVTMLALLAIRNGLTLTSIDVLSMLFPRTLSDARDPNVHINARGQQIVSIGVSDSGYTPTTLTIDPGRETWIYATADKRPSGCASMLTAPSFNLSTPINAGGNWLGPIKNPEKDFVVACSVGRLKTNIHVRRS